MFVRVKRRMLRPTKTARALAEDRDVEPEFALDFLLVESRRVGGQPRHRHLGYLGTIPEAAVVDPVARGTFWSSVDRRLDRLGLLIGTQEGERLRAMLAARVNPVGDADHARIRLEDANDSAFVALVDQCRYGGDCSEDDAHNTSNQLATDQGDDIRLAHVLRFREAFPLDIRADLLLHAWKEVANASCFDFSVVVAAFRELGDRAFEVPPPRNSLRVYRDVGPTGLVRGMAWKTELEPHSIFIRRTFEKQKGTTVIRPARIYTANVEPEGVIATYRYESEVVVDPAFLSDVRLLRFVDPEGLSLL